jgi:hypothetical protein
MQDDRAPHRRIDAPGMRRSIVESVASTVFVSFLRLAVLQEITGRQAIVGPK